MEAKVFFRIARLSSHHLIGMLELTQALNSFLKDTRVLASLRFTGRLFQSWTVLGMNDFFAVPVLRFLTSLRRLDPTLSCSCLVCLPGLSPICSWIYSGFLSILVLNISTRLWNMNSCFMLSQPHWVSSKVVGVCQGSLVTHRAALFCRTWSMARR